MKIPVPPASAQDIKAVPLASVYPGIPTRNVLVADHIPVDESAALKRFGYKVQVRLYSIYPAMQAGLPPIDSDPRIALRESYTDAHRKEFPEPTLPDVYAGKDRPDLGTLALASPYACFLEKALDGYLHWDLKYLSAYERHDGLLPLGVRVLFDIDKKSGTLRASAIESELGRHTPDDAEWPTAHTIALSAVTTATSLVRHFTWVHLACGGPLAIATRNRLPGNHPLCRLIWPHMFGTQYSNDMITMGLLAKGGDFDSTFTFTHAGLCDLVSDTYDRYRISVVDPEKDWRRRGLAGTKLKAPVQENLKQLFDVMHAHARRYVRAYYPSEKALQDDKALGDWLAELETLIPNGISEVLGDKVSRDGVARLVAAFIYMATVQHEALGTGLWNYQLWVHKHPVRTYANGQREPLDIYQRLVNANFNLNIDRAELMRDFSYLAIDQKGAELFDSFQQDLAALQNKMDAEPYAHWKTYPKVLEANINA